MTLSAARPLSMSALSTQYGGALSASFSSYLKGGALVPNTGANATVPTVRPMKLSDFLGQGAAGSVGGALSVTTTGSPTSTSTCTGASCKTSRKVQSGIVTAVASGGTGTAVKTYAWARVSGSTAITATTPSAAATYFSATVGANATLSAVFRVTVNDGSTTATADVTVSLTYEYDPSGGSSL